MYTVGNLSIILILSHLFFCFRKGIAIFCMLLTYYMWIKAVKTGSIYWSSICALAYFYMVSVISGDSNAAFHTEPTLRAAFFNL